MGQSRRAALKSRLQALEELFCALQVKSGEEADRLLQQIRSADDFRSLLDLKHDMSPLGASGSSSSSPGVSSLSSPTTGSEPSLGSVTPVRKSAIARLLQESQVGSDTLGKAHVPASSPARRELSADTSTFLISLVIPSSSITQAAVDSFFSSSGKLFHVFSRNHISGYYENVFGSDGCPVPSQKAAICCLAAVAAVGVQYNADDFELGTDGVFYDVARHFFENLMEEQPLDAIKVCTLLAMYNIMNKATVSLAYIGSYSFSPQDVISFDRVNFVCIDVGLSMSKRHNLNDKCYQYPGLSPEEWVDYRRTWRTLLFFSRQANPNQSHRHSLTLFSWLSSTLGYISGGNISFREVAPVLNLDLSSPSAKTDMTTVDGCGSRSLIRH